MKTKYTKEQITEAIKYWTCQLKLMDEACESCVDALISAFGHDLVTSRDFTYNITKDDLIKMYDILNFTLFKNELGHVRIEYWPIKMIAEKMNENALKSEVYDYKYHEPNAYGVFSAVCKDVKHNDEIIDIRISEEIIMINKSKMYDCVFIFAVATLCHEMIHYYDRFSVEFHDKQLHASRTGEDFDSHKDKIFQDMMREANDRGINVIELDGGGFRMANINARDVLYRVLGEEDDMGTIVGIGKSRVTLRGKGSSTSMFAEFD